jgi:SAM-dependent methyltransferase
MQQEKVIGYDAQAYTQREQGYSPEPIRDAVWALVGDYVEGVLLDAGSGEGGWIKILKQNNAIKRIISVDIVDDGASQIEGIEFHLSDLSDSTLPCLDSELDWVFALEVLEHLANPRHFVQEVHRCLTNGGKFVITTPNNESLRAKLSFLFRGYFPAFCDHDYHSAGHITPIIGLDLQRMADESGFSEIQFFYPLSGRIPKTSLEWRKLIPLLKGKLWSDCLFAILTK